MKKLLFLLILLAGITAFLYAYSQKILFEKQIINQEIVFKINKGDTLKKISNNLKNKGIIVNDWAFVLYVRLANIYPKIKAGEYLISEPVSMVDIADILSKGSVYYRKITFPEGITSHEIKEILMNNEFLTGEIEDIEEGEFLPETYTFSRGASRQSIINQAKKSLSNILDEAWNNRDITLPLKSKEELLILASIVEKETGLPKERPQVASVFVNRLKIGMLLQTDPTVIYAVTLGKKDLGRPIYKKDLAIDSPYNTYKYAGLPPTPICNPGKDAILAAAKPDTTPYLYFVASGSGGHNFAKTLAEHNKNVQKWRALSK